MYVVYALIDPRDNSIRYVGITTNVYKRFIEHIQCSSANYAKNAWMHELRAANKMVIMETLEEVETQMQAMKRETYWIQHFQMLKEPIANINQTYSARASKRTNLVTGHRISVDIASANAVTTAPQAVYSSLIKEERSKEYLFSDIEKPILINLYSKFHSIEECLKTMKKGARYHKDASRLLKNVGLL